MQRKNNPKQTIENIISVAGKLFLEKGYDKTSMQDIVHALGMSKGAVTHHFYMKEDTEHADNHIRLTHCTKDKRRYTMKRFTKKITLKRVRKMLLITLCSLVAIAIIVFAGLRLIAPTITRSQHKIEDPGIDLMEMVEIGGIQQALYFRGQDIDNPVILWVHGGPGNSMMPYIHLYQYEWEEEFTVVNWDQRNVGKTYLANDPETVTQTMSADRVLEDLHEVTEYIKQKLNKDKIILMGHSWGTILGTMAVQTYPEDYSAYIGIAQVINMADNERVGYEKTLEMAKAAEDQKAIKALEAVAPYPPLEFGPDYVPSMKIVRNYQSKYGLSVTMSFGNIIGILATPYNSNAELKNAMFNQENVINSQGDLLRFLVDEADIRTYGANYSVPVYYIMGENDYNSPYLPAKEFFDEIEAPDKGIFSIPDASHMPFLDNKDEFNRVLLEEIAPEIRE